jgi:hypothetical protein
MSAPNQQHNLNQQVQHPHAQHAQHTQWTHDTTVRGTDQDTAAQQHHPTFPSQQLDNRSHQVQVSDTNGLMNGYGAAPHSQYPNTSPSLAYAPADVTGLGSQQSIQTSQQSQAQHRRNNAAVAAATVNQQDNQVPYYNGTSVTPSTTAAAAAAAAVSSPLPPNTSYSLASNWATPAPSTNTTTNHSTNNNASTTPMMSQVSVAQSPSGTAGSGSLLPPPEGIYRSFEDLLPAVQRAAKDQGYGVVKLRASNYREINGTNKPTRYDLVCDRGGVKYNSTAKKRNPSTRKIDCPWRAKAVCEVQLGGQWRFVVQDARHNHDPRVATVAPGQEATPVEKQLKSLTNKMDRLMHDQAEGFARQNESLMRQGQDFAMRLDNIEKRLESLEAGGRATGLLSASGAPNMGGQNMPPANMGGGGLGNGALTNGGMGNGMGGGGLNTGMGNPGMGGGGGMSGMGNGVMDQGRLSNIEARMNAMEQRTGMDMPMMDGDPNRVDSLLM